MLDLRVLAASLNVQDEKKRPTGNDYKTACIGMPVCKGEMLEKEIVEGSIKTVKLGKGINTENHPLLAVSFRHCPGSGDFFFFLFMCVPFFVLPTVPLC